jgi:manganese transport protein
MTKHHPKLTLRELLKYVGPGLLVTVGFIDPGNWAANVAAGAAYGYTLLWMVTLSTIMLIVLQHNAAHLGIATGYCLSESATKHLRPQLSLPILSTAMLAAVSTALAEILGGAIALNMIFHTPIPLGALLVMGLVLWLLFSNSYRRIEKIIIGFVSIIGLAFLYELFLVWIDVPSAIQGWVTPRFPNGAMMIIMSVLGAVVMPHNLFLHSEIIQSRQLQKASTKQKEAQLKYEFYDTLFSMLVGWAINSSMIILAAATFFVRHQPVTELSQAQQMLTPILGSTSAIVFAIALLCAGIASSVTAGLAGGSICAGIFKEPYDIRDWHTKLGVGITLIAATTIILFIKDTFQGLIISQMLLSIQLPITIFLQIYLTSSKKVMGKYTNSLLDSTALWIIGIIVTLLNIFLFLSFL